MKFTVAALLAALATTCFAESASFTSPPNGTTVASGQNISFQVTYDQSLAAAASATVDGTGLYNSHGYFFNLSQSGFKVGGEPSQITGKLQKNLNLIIPSVINNATIPNGPAKLSLTTLSPPEGLGVESTGIDLIIANK